MRCTVRRLGLACLVALVLPSHGIAQTTISTEADPNFGNIIYTTPPPITFGQTFRAPNTTDLMLNRFRVYLGSVYATQPTFTARLAEWDAAASRMGSVLFEQSGTAPAVKTSLDFNIGQLLTFGVDYVFAISLAGGTGTSYYLFDNPYAQGSYVVIPSDNLTTLQTENTASWDGSDAIVDLMFAAEFAPPVSTVPEPMSLILLGTGLAGLGAAARRRRTPK